MVAVSAGKIPGSFAGSSFGSADLWPVCGQVRVEMQYRNRRAQNDQAARAAAGEVAARLQQLKPEDLPPVHVVVYKGATAFVKNYPATSFLYILGLGLMCFASGNAPFIIKLLISSLVSIQLPLTSVLMASVACSTATVQG